MPADTSPAPSADPPAPAPVDPVEPLPGATPASAVTAASVCPSKGLVVGRQLLIRVLVVMFMLPLVFVVCVFALASRPIPDHCVERQAAGTEAVTAWGRAEACSPALDVNVVGVLEACI